MVTIKNIGTFKIPAELMRKDTELVAEMFAQLKIIPVRCEMLFAENRFHYTAISENFEELQAGACPPEYHLIANRNEDGTYTFSVEQISNGDNEGVGFDIVNAKNEVIAKVKACEHPIDKRKAYHDDSVVCEKCNCVIEQYGKVLANPCSLGMKY